MEKEFKLLIKELEKFDGFTLIDASFESSWIHFKLTNEISLSNISNQILDIKDQYPCSLMVLSNHENLDDLSYQLIIEADDKLMAIKMLTKNLKTLIESGSDVMRSKYKEFGLPDLTFVTIRQMATELKQRHNLIFALVWIENNERDNIAIEGSGNPTQLVGLLARGSHMAIEWADKNIKFYRPNNEE